jgi:thiamine kinase-like enzyme
MADELDSAVPADLEALFSQVLSLARRPRSVQELPGGLTNRNYRVTTPDGIFVARVSAAGGELLAIDREHEYRNSVTAAAAGVGAPVIEYCPAAGVMVIGYLPGRTLTNADVAEPGNLTRIAAACRQLHAGGRFVNDFNMFEIQQRYLDVARSRGFRVPAGYDALMPQFAAARAALEARDEGTVPCNNDPCFELGNIWGECRLSLDGLAGLVTAYYGRPLRSKIARARLLGLAGMYGWTLWGAIQSATSPIDFDFWSWGMERFDGAAQGMRAPDFAGLLDEAQRDD